MLERRTLAYGDGRAEKPKITKRLVFGVVALLTTAGCIPTSLIPRNQTEVRIQQTQRRTQIAEPVCFRDGELSLEPSEVIVESVCRTNREFVITNFNFYVRVNDGEEGLNHEITMRSHYSRTDIRDYVARGIVDLEIGDDSVFILTKADRRLTCIPFDDMGETVLAYDMPFNTSTISRDRMVYRAGFLFIAPESGNGLVMSFGEHDDIRNFQLPSSPDAVFFLKDNRLFFGRDGREEMEVRINGPRVSDISFVGQ